MTEGGEINWKFDGKFRGNHQTFVQGICEVYKHEILPATTGVKLSIKDSNQIYQKFSEIFAADISKTVNSSFNMIRKHSQQLFCWGALDWVWKIKLLKMDTTPHLCYRIRGRVLQFAFSLLDMERNSIGAHTLQQPTHSRS